MRIDYDAICQMAAALGRNRTDLIALSPNNDPFYTGVQARKDAAEWFAVLWTRLNFKVGSHPRRLHYIVVSQDPPILKPSGEPYQNVNNDWKSLLSASLSARYHGLIPDRALADHRNDPPLVCAEPALRKRLSCSIDSPMGFNFLTEDISRDILKPGLTVENMLVPQDYLVEVWVEKSTQNDILAPLAQRLGFNLQTGTGEMSEILAREAIDRAMTDGRPMRILYISDFDPGGRSMPVALARKIEYWVRSLHLNLDITLDPILLTPAQCEHYKLPRTPLKETEKRAAKFEERFGEGATELDALEALHPGEMARIVESEARRYIDPSLRSRVNAKNIDLKRRAWDVEKQILARHDCSAIETEFADLVEEFENNVQDLEDRAEALWPEIAADLEANIPVFDPNDIPAPKPASPPSEPLFDSKRSYLDQIDHYRAWQGRGGE